MDDSFGVELRGDPVVLVFNFDAALDNCSLVVATADAIESFTWYFSSMSCANFFEDSQADEAPADTVALTLYCSSTFLTLVATALANALADSATPLNIDVNVEAFDGVSLFCGEGARWSATGNNSTLILFPSTRALFNRQAVLAAAAESNLTTASLLPLSLCIQQLTGHGEKVRFVQVKHANFATKCEKVSY